MENLEINYDYSSIKNYIDSTFTKMGKIPLKTLILICFKTLNHETTITKYIKDNYTIYTEDNITFVKNLSNDNEISKGEFKIIEILEKNKIVYEYQKYFDKCEDKTYLPFDFYIPCVRTCIEYDGEQHFYPINAFGGMETYNNIRSHDIIKNKYCDDNNIKLIRIKYDVDDNSINKIIGEVINDISTNQDIV